MSLEADLAATQRWLQAVITAPGEDAEALRSPEAARQIPPGRALEAVKPSWSLTALERLGIYRGMYEARMREALEVDYPLLAGFLGPELWEQLISLYIRQYPSRSYTLNRLGDYLPLFLNELEGLPRPRFAADLARYEFAISSVFDAPEDHAITPEDAARVPEDAWEDARLVPIRAFRLEAFHYPVSRYAEAVREDPRVRPPRPQKTWLVIFRRDYTPLSLELSRPAFGLFSRLASGSKLGEALRRSRMSEDEIFRWFRQWMAEGLFQRVEFGAPVNGSTLSESLRPSFQPGS